MANMSLADRVGVIVLARRLAQDEKEAGKLSDAEATCRTLSSTVRDDPDRPASDDLRNDIILDLACIVRAQGRLDEARQLCEEVANQHVLHTNLCQDACVCLGLCSSVYMMERCALLLVFEDRDGFYTSRLAFCDAQIHRGVSPHRITVKGAYSPTMPVFGQSSVSL